jgi:hypothetical protein
LNITDPVFIELGCAVAVLEKMLLITILRNVGNTAHFHIVPTTKNSTNINNGSPPGNIKVITVCNL